MQHTPMWLPKTSSPTSRPKHTGTVIRTCLNKMMYFGMSLKKTSLKKTGCPLGNGVFSIYFTEFSG